MAQFTPQMHWFLQHKQCCEVFQEQGAAYNCYMAKEIMHNTPKRLSRTKLNNQCDKIVPILRKESLIWISREGMEEGKWKKCIVQ